MRGPKVSITTALDCHPSTYRLFYCESTLMGHALVGRSIILPANPRSVHRLAKELPLASEPPAPPYPHLRNQGSARAACTARGPRAAARSCARSVPRAARARTLWPDSRAPGTAPRRPPSPNPYSTDALGQSHTVSPSLPLSLPPHCGPPPPARTGPRRPSSLLSPCHVQRAHAHSCQRADNVLFWPAVTLPSFSLRRPPHSRRSPSPPRSAALPVAAASSRRQGQLPSP